MNLMPPVSAGRKYFYFGLTIILFWLIQLMAFVMWLYLELHTVEDRMAAHRSEILEAKSAVEEKVKEREAFMAQHGPEVYYRIRVEELLNHRIAWEEGMRLLREHLPDEATLFRAEAEGTRLDAWAAFPTADSAAAFLEKLKDNPEAQDVFLDCIGKNCTDSGTKVSPETAEVVHFHFHYRKPVPPTGTGEVTD